MRVRHALSVVLLAVVFATAAGCSRENQDWRSAQASDTIEGYDDFVAKHAQSEFAQQAKGRVKQLTEERDWERATVADTAEAYQQFLTQHADGKWAQEARIRVENFNVLDGTYKPAANGAAASGAAASGAAAALGAAAGAAAAKTARGATPPSSGAVPGPFAPPKPVQAAAPKPPLNTVAKTPVKVPAKASATVATPHKAPPVSKTAAGSRRIQLGAFSSEAKANQERQRLAAKFAELKGLPTHVTGVTTPAGKLFRLQADVPNKERGAAICAALAARKQGCVPVHR